MARRLDSGGRALRLGWLAVITLLAGCLDTSALGPTSKVRIVNLFANPERQPLHFRLDGVAAGQSVPFLGVSEYADGNQYRSVTEGAHTVGVKWSTDTTQVVGNYGFVIGQFEDRTVYVTALDGFTGIHFEDDRTAPAAGEVRLRVVNLSPIAGPSDVFVTAPSADLATATPSASFIPVGGPSLYFSVAPGTYRVRFVPAGTPAASRASSVTIDIAAQTWASSVRSIVAANALDGLTATGLVLLDYPD